MLKRVIGTNKNASRQYTNNLGLDQATQATEIFKAAIRQLARWHACYYS